ncbi:hypothetical protein AVEN_107797-1 [Araneus ventricosus]|uniref:Uncharacterized protein n=1 Tax=Araneus ventricosus TaxID=182803 RepID=A0A4Y2I3F0_ARAVE|nr:hypothetical protein AVEN_107797-1 [Araneus ventricosus]
MANYILCEASLTCLINPTSPCFHYFLYLTKLVKTYLGYEKADFIAKLVTERSPYINWIASEDILSHMKHNSNRRTSGHYRDSKYYEELGEIPDIRSIFKWTKNRREDIICARIFSKTLNIFKRPGIINLSDNPMCNTCNVMNNLDHILLHCSRYSTIRGHLWNKLGLVSSTTYRFKELTSKVFENKQNLHIFLQNLKFDIF